MPLAAAALMTVTHDAASLRPEYRGGRGPGRARRRPQCQCHRDGESVTSHGRCTDRSTRAGALSDLKFRSQAEIPSNPQFISSTVTLLGHAQVPPPDSNLSLNPFQKPIENDAY